MRVLAETLPSPVPEAGEPRWGSDVVANILRRLGVEYVAINPGASFRGLHDSLVNYLGNRDPTLVLCNHEEVAVSIAHGFAKATGKPMAAVVHSNVGLLHAAMAIFNAWVDRQPVLVIGATGPMDATRRRPWIDWIHTSQGQGAVVRDFTKWEHQPGSLAAVPEALLRAWHTMQLAPQGPVYVCLDVELQEQAIDLSAPPLLLDPANFPLPPDPTPPQAFVDRAADLLIGAQRPVILAGGPGREPSAWRDLVDLAETLGAAVLTDLKQPACFPTNHPLHQTSPAMRGDAAFYRTLASADVVLALQWIDPAGTLRGVLAPTQSRAARTHSAQQPALIDVSLERYAVRSWSADYQELPAAAVPIAAATAPTIAALLAALRERIGPQTDLRDRALSRRTQMERTRGKLEQEWRAAHASVWDRRPMHLVRLVSELKSALNDKPRNITLVRAPLAWPAGVWDFADPYAYLGFDGGAGIGAGPGLAVGAALGLLGSGRLPVAILGDGDLLMANTALWTAAHHRIPLLFVVANNRTYLNDEAHQTRVAQARDRPVENRGVGQRMDDPAVDFASLARSMGVDGFGPIDNPNELRSAYERALRIVDEGRPAVVDVVIGRDSA